MANILGGLFEHGLKQLGQVLEYGNTHMLTITDFKKAFPRTSKAQARAYMQLTWYCTKEEPGILPPQPPSH